MKNSSFVLRSSKGDGSRALQLDVDLATYVAPDRVRVLALDGSGKETLIFDSCRMSSWTEADPTNGKSRPQESTIRFYRPKLPAGTKSLKFDWSQATTPTYFRVVGLCDFDLTPTKKSGSVPAVRSGAW
jgi:hypothetical protein